MRASGTSASRDLIFDYSIPEAITLLFTTRRVDFVTPFYKAFLVKEPLVAAKKLPVVFCDLVVAELS